MKNYEITGWENPVENGYYDDGGNSGSRRWNAESVWVIRNNGDVLIKESRYQFDQGNNISEWCKASELHLFLIRNGVIIKSSHQRLVWTNRDDESLYLFDLPEWMSKDEYLYFDKINLHEKCEKPILNGYKIPYEIRNKIDIL